MWSMRGREAKGGASGFDESTWEKRRRVPVWGWGWGSVLWLIWCHWTTLGRLGQVGVESWPEIGVGVTGIEVWFKATSLPEVIQG